MSKVNDDARLALVVDGGGTKTDCMVLRQFEGGSQVLSKETATGCNPAAIGVQVATKEIRRVCRRAIATAKVGDEEIKRGAFAIAGTLDPELRQSLEAQLQDGCKLATKCRVFPDILPIALAASSHGTGVALIAGTGSAAAVRLANRDLRVVGGWGYLLGDEGSGFWLGREAVRSLLKCFERNQPLSLLGEAICQELHIHSAAQLKRWVYGAADMRRNLASLSSLVQLQAGKGDPSAIAIVKRAAELLVELIDAAVSNQDLGEAEMPVALAGGVLDENSPIAAQVRRILATRPQTGTIVHVAEPIQACTLLLDEPLFGSPLVVSVN